MFVERIVCDLPRIAAEAASMTRPKAMEKGLSLKLEFTTPIPRAGLTDPLRLRQVLVNLIGNAIKFTPAGSVIVRVSCDVPSKSDTSIRFQVVDTGVGMSGTEIQGLFRPFTQADVSTTRRFGGTGLGLTISRQFVRMLGGDISVQSEPGKGSTFTFETKVGPVAAENLVQGLTESGIENSQITGSADMAHRLDGVSVLLAEDGIDNREILTAYLRGAGALVETVENGQDAVRVALESHRNGKPFTVILMDMQMPIQDGYNATSELRRNGYDRPIIALTAHAMADDRAKCLAAGCSDYLSKPVERAVLVNTILQNIDLPGVPALNQNAPSQEEKVVPTVLDSSETSVIRSDLASDSDFQSVLVSFVTRLPVIVGELTTFAKSRDMAGLTQSLHQLKGAGGSYGFGMLSQLAGAAEAKLLSGESIDAVEPQVAELVAYIQRIEGYDATTLIDAAA